MGKAIIITVVVTIGIQLIWMAYEKLLYREGLPDDRDRIAIKPGPMSWLLCLSCTGFCIAFGGATIVAVATQEYLVFWLLLGPPLTALMGFGAYVSSWTRLRATGAYVEHRALSGWVQTNWDDVIGVFHHSMLGPRLHVKNRKPVAVWVYGNGAREVRELFAMYEKPFAS